MKYLKVLVKENEYIIEVSLSDEKNYAIANIIIYEKHSNYNTNSLRSKKAPKQTIGKY